jgi:hypothetical protein
VEHDANREAASKTTLRMKSVMAPGSDSHGARTLLAIGYLPPFNRPNRPLAFSYH